MPPGTRPAEGFVDRAPDLAIEVKSPDNTDRWLATRAERYFAAGARRVWIVRPAGHTVTVHLPEGEPREYGPGDTLTGDDAGFPVEGFQLPVDHIFAFEQ